MPIRVRFSLSVIIEPIPTGAGGIVRGGTITVKGGAICTKHTSDTTDPDRDKDEDSPRSISEVEVRFGSGGFVKATPTGPVSAGQKLWSTWTTGPRVISGAVNDKMLITVRASTLTGAGGGIQSTATLTVGVDRTP